MTGAELAEILDAVREDPELTPAEKETTLTLTKPDDAFQCYTAEAGIARRVLAHPATDEKVLTVDAEDGYADVPIDEYAGGSIVGVRARVPVGAVTIRRDPRKSTSHAAIVTDRVLEEVRP